MEILYWYKLLGPILSKVQHLLPLDVNGIKGGLINQQEDDTWHILTKERFIRVK